VVVGTPIVVIENHWAVMTLKANGKGILKKTSFERGTSVKSATQSLSSVPMERIFPTGKRIRHNGRLGIRTLRGCWCCQISGGSRWKKRARTEPTAEATRR
jgi:hypothetical protein